MDDIDRDGADGSEEKDCGGDPALTNTDGDELNDWEEYKAGTDASMWSPSIDLYYRVVTVYDYLDDYMETRVRKLLEEEREKTSNKISLSDVSPAGPIHYPAIGNPVLLSSASLDWSFDIHFEGKYGSDKIHSGYIKKDDGKRYDLEISKTYYDKYSGLIRAQVCIKSPILSVESGLYDLYVTINSEEYKVPHAVQMFSKYKTPFKFIQITDTHIGNLIFSSNNNVGDLLAIINRINRVEHPEFVIITGDLTDFGTKEQMEYFKACMLKSDIPIFTTPGNHDYYLEQCIKKGAKNLLGLLNPVSLYHYLSGDDLTNYAHYYGYYINPWVDGLYDCWGYDYTFTYNYDMFIVFDSKWGNTLKDPPHTAGLTTSQLQWMKNIQDYARNHFGYLRTFVFTHATIVGHDDQGTHHVVRVFTDKL